MYGLFRNRRLPAAEPIPERNIRVICSGKAPTTKAASALLEMLEDS